MALGFAILFAFMWYYDVQQEIKRKSETICKTTSCNRNFRSSLDDLRYFFYYKGKKFSSSSSFSKKKRGDKICKDHYFVVTFDSLSPENSELELDRPSDQESFEKTLPENEKKPEESPNNIFSPE